MKTTLKGNILGIDLGSRNVKICHMTDGVVKDVRRTDTMEFYKLYASRSGEKLNIDLTALGYETPNKVIATGYGRNTAGFVATVISELRAHMLGAIFQTGLDDFTLLDMGGQDYKVIRVKNRRMVDMATNDKCAASTGRYLENMAGVLGITLDELGKYSENPVLLSSTCAIFGESEVIGHIVSGKQIGHIAAGVNNAIVERVLPLIKRMDPDKIVLSGGVALNQAVREILHQKTGIEITHLPDPVHNGALGCCLH
jgi:predicted CoA-substrate-specific enzyme activase